MALSSRLGMERVREILQMRREGNAETIAPDSMLIKRYAEKRNLYQAKIKCLEVSQRQL